MREIDRAVTRIIHWPNAYILPVFFILIVANNVAFAVRIDHVPVARIGDDKAAFSTAGDEPILAPDYTGVPAAGDADIRIILLCAVNVIGKGVVDRDVIKLRRRLIILRGPGLAAVHRNACASVIRVADTICVLRINPETVMIAVTGRKQIKCFCSIN